MRMPGWRATTGVRSRGEWGVASDATENLADVVARVATGDRPAFRSLYDRTSPRLFALALRILRDSEAAEEALQDAFLLIWKKAGSYDRRLGDPSAWMAAIVRNRALDVLRERRRTATREQPCEDLALLADAAPAVHADGWEGGGRRLEVCLSRLSEDQRKCIFFAYYEGMTHQEIASVLGKPLGTVKSWLRRGLSKLKDCLSDDD